MFDFSWGEILMIGAVALIVIGPKELPAALRTVGRMVGKVKRMASEFQGQFNEALREADLDKVRKDVEGMNRAASGSFNPVKTIRDEMKGAIDKPGAAAAAASSNAAAFSGTKVAGAGASTSAPASTGGGLDAQAVEPSAAVPPQAGTGPEPQAGVTALPDAPNGSKPATGASGSPAQNAEAVASTVSADSSRTKEEKQT